MSLYRKYKRINKWIRPIDLLYFEGSHNFWGNFGILPDGARQGALGDCWLLASAAALAEHPNRIKQVFANRESNEEGFYILELWFLGR